MSEETTVKFHHKEHNAWINKLDFYQDEIKIFQNNLSKVIQAHPDLYSIIEIVDEYRKILLKKLKKIDNMRYQIALHEHRLATGADVHMSELIWDHHEVRDRLLEFESNFDKLKSAIRHFMSKYIK